MVAAGIVGLMLVASLNLLGGAARARLADNDRRTASMLAQQLMAEVQQQPYKDESITALLFGPELGESTGTRAAFDDVDDYDKFQETPPRLKDGTELVGYVGWKRKVKVTWVQPGSLATSNTDSGLELVEVVVTDPQGKASSVFALRSAYLVADPPPSGTTSLLWTGIELESGGEAARRTTAGVGLLIQPPTP